MKRETVGRNLSLRARNAVYNVLSGNVAFVPAQGADISYDKTDNLTRRALKRALEQARVSSKRWHSIGQMLLVTKNCGHLTVREIMTWIGMAYAIKPHVCVCRTCGRQLGRSPASSSGGR